MSIKVLPSAVSEFWAQQAPRERQFLTVGIAVVCVSLLYFVGIQPALTTISKLEKANPQSKQQVAQMNQLASQYAQMSSLMAEPIASLNREAIDASLLRRQLKAQSLTMSEDSVRIQLNAARYANVMEWMLEVQKAMRLYVDEVKFTGQMEVGQVNVVISLKQHRKTN